MNAKLLLLLILLLSACREPIVAPTTNCNTYNSNQEHLKGAAISNLMIEYRKKGLPGMAIMIKDQEGEWIGAEGKADIDKDIDMQPCHISQTASITKLFFAALALKLHEEKTLDINRPVSEYLPSEITQKIENAEQITLYMLLNHSSGLYNHSTDRSFYLDILNNPTKRWKAKELMEYVYDHPSRFPPGTNVSYSNSNTLLASLVVDYATGVKHGKLLRDKILDPLRLNDTFYPFHDNLPEHGVAQGYFDLYNNGKIVNISNYNTGIGNGYNGLHSTVIDLHTFLEALLINKTVLSQESLDIMLEINPIKSNDTRFGVGVIEDFLDRRDPLEYGIGHGGRDLAYTGELFYFPEKNVSFSLLMNYGNDTYSRLNPIYLDFRRRLVNLLME
ncbi:serine hydrolase domain-containing protein [Cytophagaceae bacterium ABcell3]|nr:serine hydrolase domain-containing protein [Cytophagaceae bacterium ABcell3]